ncbi:MAG: acetyl-CoA decarbonylase/synthase complex subunit delta, partial [Opitutaceae bacterium]
DLLDKIADETIATDPKQIRAFMEKTGHPALKLPDLGATASTAAKAPPAAASKPPPALEAAAVQATPPAAPAAEPKPDGIPSDWMAQIKAKTLEEFKRALEAASPEDLLRGVMEALNRKPAGNAPAPAPAAPVVAAPKSPPAAVSSARERLAAVTAFPVRKERCEVPVCTVKLGALRSEGGTRGRTYRIGGATAMPFHLWEGEMPNRPLVALEVFDAVSEKYPRVLREYYGDLLLHPAEMAKVCVEKHGADLINVRLEGTHPEKGNRTPEQAVELVKSVLAAVDVPLIVTGHNHFDRNNDVMKAIAAACAGENLLLNWVEQNNYRTIAGAAMGYGHCVVSQSPIDVNISKQMNILLTNMDLKREQIVIDPLTGAMGYGIEYTYSVMERIRLTGLSGDPMLALPIIACPGQECAKIKELRAAEADMPVWGDLQRRATLWELTTALSLLYAGADILIMYNPEAAAALRRTITRLMDQGPAQPARP